MFAILLIRHHQMRIITLPLTRPNILILSRKHVQSTIHYRRESDIGLEYNTCVWSYKIRSNNCYKIILLWYQDLCCYRRGKLIGPKRNHLYW